MWHSLLRRATSLSPPLLSTPRLPAPPPFAALRSPFASVRSMFAAASRPAALAPLLRLSPLGAHRGMRTKSRLGRGTRHRWDMLKNMATSLLEHERIYTTLAKAKELRRVADKLITFGKRGTLQGRRKAREYVRTEPMLAKLFTIMAYRYRNREGGYTRVLKTYPRMGDGAKMAYIEYVDREDIKMPRPLPEQVASVYAGRDGRKYKEKNPKRNTFVF